MSMIVTVQIVDDHTNKVTDTYSTVHDTGVSYNLYRHLVKFFSQVFKDVFGLDNDDW